VADRPQLPGVGEHHLADVSLQDPQDRQRVAGRLEHNPVVRAKALGEQLKLLRRRRDTPRRARPAPV
jgi:hypothetical protein